MRVSATMEIKKSYPWKQIKSSQLRKKSQREVPSIFSMKNNVLERVDEYQAYCEL